MRKDYLLLDKKIKAEYVSYIKEHGEIPTETYVAELCGTSQTTVSKHLTNINLDELVRPFKLFGNDVLLGLKDRAKKGDANAAKLYFALVYDYNEKTEQKVDTSVTIQFEDVENEKDKRKKNKDVS